MSNNLKKHMVKTPFGACILWCKTHIRVCGELEWKLVFTTAQDFEAGVHAGKLTGAKATEVLTNEDALFSALLEVNKLYKPNDQPVIFDLQVETEILGCDLVWEEKGPPSVASHPLAQTASAPCKCTLPKKEDGRIPLILNVMHRMKKAVGETTALYGLVCGPFTLASHLRGTDIFMDMYDDEEYVKKLLEYCNETAKNMSAYYIEATW